MNDKRISQYLILPENGNRKDTKLAVEYDEAQIADYLKQGYVIVSHDDFNKLIGNDNGEYLIADDGSVYPKPAPTDAELLPAAKQAKLAEVSQWTAANITGGFISSASGEPVRYDSDVDTQLTMQGIALNVSTPLFAAKYPNGCPVRGVAEGKDSKAVYLLSPQQVMQWMADLSMHIGNCKQEGWQKQAEVNACKTVAEVDAIKL
ncbi:MAG TPA: hypothetical protein DCQ00_08965 [Phascolarctobacterium succinatutens]|uniref:DUF4376 domain-containing protein n=1 Tax=Phascolarctobacterium succinatutens TaxID=626940 RepID=UPI000EC70817|nr:hypothetical protein [Phascolarctobacterium succinatutens]HAM93611.1 hypothetical protein [Phascolarctobacterium succinatutens]